MLRDIAPQDLFALLPAVVRTSGGQIGVVLRLVDAATGEVELYRDHEVTRTTTQAMQAEFVLDHAVQAEYLRDALKEVQSTAARDRAQQTLLHDRKLEDIREYAIERHEAGDICREGLNNFLEHFDFDPYVTRVKVKFTMTGSFVVDSDSAGATEDDVNDYLKPDLSSVDNVDDQTVDYEVTVDEAYEL
ncbi:hypothetical protein KSE_52150 [Kitasatospora setae KM-6054]|uniref:Uncharacterized protein n=2 Tax=Streptomycetaceae TaxID=2062 RepID=E4NHL1_KITSK|nr:hypothetical protein KSE_52150 [Kitasatospora setae KM-6054]